MEEGTKTTDNSQHTTKGDISLMMIARLVGCILGLQFAYITWGVLQVSSAAL